MKWNNNNKNEIKKSYKQQRDVLSSTPFKVTGKRKDTYMTYIQIQKSAKFISGVRNQESRHLSGKEKQEGDHWVKV